MGEYEEFPNRFRLSTMQLKKQLVLRWLNPFIFPKQKPPAAMKGEEGKCNRENSVKKGRKEILPLCE